MSVSIVAGVQWGDEGKGRIVDLLASEADVVVRCQGGPNAGHTVVNDRGEFVLHTVPSGIFSDRATCVIGAGTVLSPTGLAEEMRGLADAGVDLGRLIISERAHLIMRYHVLIDRLEDGRRSSDKVGTTGRGVGPAYADKAMRCGLMAGDLSSMDRLRARLSEVLPWKNRMLQEMYGHAPLELEGLLAELEPAVAFLAPHVGDTVAPIQGALASGRQVMLEGQLGIMRDLDWGAYPFVTSSSPIPAGMAAGAGIPVSAVDRVIGVVKAYTTAVGEGPFPTELTGPEGDSLRERGGEYGATTGRPRRCGWFDAVAVKWACQVAGFTELALTKVDVLDGIERLPMCTAYRNGAGPLESFPTAPLMAKVEPVYNEMSGWSATTASARTVEELPAEARSYIDEIERRAGVPVTMVSVGRERDAIVMRGAR